MKIQLTAEVGAFCELGGHHGVHRDHDLPLLRHDGVTFLDLFCDPLFEVLANHCSADVYYPLLGDLRQVRLVRQIGLDVRLRCNKLHHAVHSQVFVLGHVQVLHGVVAHVGLLSAHDIF